MKPDPGRVLQGVGMSLLTSVLSEVRTPYGQQTVSVAGGLVFMVADEFDRAADRLVTENAAVRQILADARPLLPDAMLPAVETALSTSPESFRISALQAENDVLRGALIEVHAAIEQAASDAARAFSERIWAELVASTKRREFATRLS